MSQVARNPLRILLSAYACEPGKGSEPGVGWNWALALARRGHQVWVLTRRNNQKTIEQEFQQIEPSLRERLSFIYYDLPNWAKWWKKGGRGVHLYYALWQRGILKVAQTQHALHRFDIVHHLTFGVWRQASPLYKLGAPFIFGPVGGGETAPWSLVRGLPSFNARINEYLRFMINGLSLLNPSLRRCLRQSTWIVSKTPETADWIAKMGTTSLVALEIGINPEKIMAGRIAFGAQSLRCLYAGRLIGWKGVHLALSGLASAVEQGADVTLTIVGEGDLSEELQKATQQLSIERRVRFVGWLSQVELFTQYQKHDLLLFPSLHDSSGNVILESFANGLPALCLKLGGPGVMVDETCGRAVDVRGLSEAAVVSRLADDLIEMAQSPDLMEHLRKGAQTRAETSSWDSVVGRVYGPVENATQLS